MSKKISSLAMQHIDKKDTASVSEVLRSNWLTTGPKVSEFEKKICKYLGCKYAVVVSNGTAALHLAVKSLEMPDKSEVITTPFTFVPDANSIVNNNYIPVFADIQPDTYNIDPEQIEKKITKKTKAILYVDYAGQPCDIDKIKKIARKHSLSLIEDAAHAFGSKYKGSRICSFADLTIFSFQPTKIITSGEGGAITTNNKKLYEKLLTLRNHGIERTPKARGWDYDVKSAGHNFKLSDFQCALGISQLSKIKTFMKKRRQIVKEYNKHFSKIAGTQIPDEKKNTKCAWYTYPLLLPKKTNRNNVYDELKKKRINVHIYYKPITHFTFYKNNFKTKKEDYPVVEKIIKRLINLPISPNMGIQDAKKIAETVIKYL